MLEEEPRNQSLVAVDVGRSSLVAKPQLEENAGLRSLWLDSGSVHMDHRTVRALVPAPKRSQTPQSFQLCCRACLGEGDEAGIELATALQENKTLQSVQLNCSVHMGDVTGIALATALQENMSLQSVQLTCRISMGDETGIALARVLQENMTLQCFQLNCSVNMGDETGTALAKALQENKTLQSFQLNCSVNMGDETGTALATALQENKTLQSFQLNFSECPMGDETDRALATALLENKTLQSFRLNTRFHMGDDTGIALATALQENKTLQSFRLTCRDSSLGDDTGRALATALQENKTLQSFQLNCSGSRMNDHTGRALATALQENMTLQSFRLDCRNSRMGDETGRALATALKENCVLQDIQLACHSTGMADETRKALALARKDALSRNGELQGQWVVAACFARHFAGRVSLGMPEKAFCRMIFGYYLPKGVAERIAANAGARSATTGAPMTRASTEADGFVAVVEDSTGTHEDIQALENVVMESIEHGEPPAMIDEQEAAQIVAVQHAGFIERNLGIAPDDATRHVEDDVDGPIFLCKLNRITNQLRSALSEGASLRICREALEAAGYAWKDDSSGALIFVQPCQYRLAMQALEHHQIDLQTDHIVVAGSIEYLVAETMSTCDGVWVQARDHVQRSSSNAATSSDEAEILSMVSEDNATTEQRDLKDAYGIVINRTFICKVSVREEESTATASTTDAHISRRANPRRSMTELCD